MRAPPIISPPGKNSCINPCLLCEATKYCVQCVLCSMCTVFNVYCVQCVLFSLPQVDLMFIQTLYGIRDVHKSGIKEEDFSEVSAY